MRDWILKITVPVLICACALSVSARAAEPKKQEMTKAEIVKEIMDDLDDEDVISFVPGIAKFKDDSGRVYYMFKNEDGAMKRLEDLDLDFLDNLSGRVKQAGTILHTQMIQRQLEQVRSMQNIQRSYQVQSPPKTVSVPPSPPRAPYQPPKIYTPPPQPQRKVPER